MRYLLLLLLLSSCSSFTRKEDSFQVLKPEQAFENCVERFLRLGVQPHDSRLICSDIHNTK